MSCFKCVIYHVYFGTSHTNIIQHAELIMIYLQHFDWSHAVPFANYENAAWEYHEKFDLMLGIFKFHKIMSCILIKMKLDCCDWQFFPVISTMQITMITTILHHGKIVKYNTLLNTSIQQ